MESVELITVSVPEGPGKPTRYCAILDNKSVDTLKRHIRKGLGEASEDLSDESLESGIDYLTDCGFTWINECYLVEITRLDVRSCNGNRYKRALEICRRVEFDGFDINDICVANEVERALSLSKGALGRSKRIRESIEEDTDGLMRIATRLLNESHGASTPRDAACQIVDAYLDSGMDIRTVEGMVKMEEIAIKYATRRDVRRLN